MAFCLWEEPYQSLLGCSRRRVQEKLDWKVGVGRDHEPFLATGKDSALVLQVMGVFGDEDVKQILKMIEPEVFTEEEEVEEEEEEEEEDEEEKEEDEEEEAHEKEDEEKAEAEEAAEEEKEELEEGLLQMKLPESVKLQMCHLLEYFCDQELQHRVESLAAFAECYVDKLQGNQRGRYGLLMKAFTMSAAETARRTREFRSPPQEQVL